MPARINSLRNASTTIATSLDLIKRTATRGITVMQAGSATAENLISMMLDLDRESTRLAANKDMAGLVAFDKEVYNDPAYDVKASCEAVIAAIDAAITTLQAGIATISDANGWIGTKKLSGRTLVERTFTAGQTASLRTNFQAIVSAIE